MYVHIYSIRYLIWISFLHMYTTLMKLKVTIIRTLNLRFEVLAILRNYVRISHHHIKIYLDINKTLKCQLLYRFKKFGESNFLNIALY